MLGQNFAPRRWPDAGKVLALVRTDAPEGGQGKPCGASHIPKAHKCSKGTHQISAEQRKRLTKLALAGGLTVTAALGLALIARGQVGGGLTPASLRAPAQPPALPGRTLKALPSRSSAPTEDELDTLEAYIFSSRRLNRSLRSGQVNAGITRDVTTIDTWMRNTPAKDSRYWRGIASEREAGFLRNASAGQTYTDAGYGSFSSSLQTARQFAEEHTANTERVIVRTRAPFHPMPTQAIDDLARRRGLFEETSGGEREFLAPRNAQYRVRRVRSGVTLNPGNIPGRRFWANRTYTIVDVDYLGADPNRSVPGKGKTVAQAMPREGILRTQSSVTGIPASSGVVEWED